MEVKLNICVRCGNGYIQTGWKHTCQTCKNIEMILNMRWESLLDTPFSKVIENSVNYVCGGV